MLIDIKSMDFTEIQDVVRQLGGQAYRAKQLFEWLHKKTINNFNECLNLPQTLIEQLNASYTILNTKIIERFEDSKDGTVKYLFELSDHNIIEAVLMKYKYGASLCISSQVGCRMGCAFCASTVNGLIRNLSASEMLEQIYTIEKDIKEPIHSVVVMGTGEPFDNYENFIRFVYLLSSPEGRNLSRRNITVSTCGIVSKIHALITDAPQINLAISLHSTTQEERRKIMPISQKYNIDSLIDACKIYTIETKRRITFEYSLIEGVNDSKENAYQLAKLLHGILCHVNLIPVNPVDHREQRPSSIERVTAFKLILENNHIQTTLRRSLGQEIDAACGQLRNRYIQQ